MKTERLDEFIVLSEKKRFSEAADELYISQSTLSRHIQELEDELGVELFDRNSKGVNLSYFGEILLPYAQKIIHLSDEMIKTFENAKKQYNSTVRIGVVRNWMYTEFANVIWDFGSANKELRIDIRQCPDLELKSLMESKEISIAFARELMENRSIDDFSRLPFSKDEVHCLIPKDDPLVAKSAIRMEDLRGHTFMLHNEKSILHLIENDVIESCGYEVSYSYRGVDLYETIAMFEGNVSVSLVFGSNLLNESMKETHVIRSFDPPIYTCTNLVYNKNILNPAEEQFISFCKKRFPIRTKS